MRLFKVRLITVLAAGLLLALAQTGWTATVNRYGGPVYDQAPTLAITASLVEAGGGPGHFSLAKALTSMIGPEMTNEEVAKLQRQYGKQLVAQWIGGFNFAVEDALKIATSKGISLPAPTLSGKELAEALVQAGVAKDHTFWTGLVFDKTLSHGIHLQVMDDVDHNPAMGTTADYNLHRISNQAFYDLAQALGHTNVQLASVH